MTADEIYAGFSKRLGYDCSVYVSNDPLTWPPDFSKMYKEWYDELVKYVRAARIRNEGRDVTPEQVAECKRLGISYKPL